MKIQHSFKRTWDAPMGDMPLVENCDPLNPRQAFLPFLMGLQQGAPMLMIEFHEAVSEHLVECLGIPLDENGRLLEPIGQSLGWQRRRKYIPPLSVMDPKRASGAWVTMDEPDPTPKSYTDIFNSLPGADQAGLVDVVKTLHPELMDNAKLPKFVKVKDFAAAVKLTPKQTVNLLKFHGQDNARTGGMIEWPAAVKVLMHLQRAGQPAGEAQ